MVKIGITGGMGSGKSVVAKIFETLGIPVFDADSQARDIMNEDARLKLQIKQSFGNVYEAGGLLNRKLLAEKVFADEEKLSVLNALVHPAVFRKFDEWEKKQKAPYVIREAAIMFESGSAAGLSMVIGVYAPRALRIKRSMKRSAISREQALDRMARQIDEEIKMRLCDEVIINDESRLVIPQVLQLHQKIISSFH